MATVDASMVRYIAYDGFAASCPTKRRDGDTGPANNDADDVVEGTDLKPAEDTGSRV